MKFLLSLIPILLLASCATTQDINSSSITAIKPALNEEKGNLRKSFLGKWISKQPIKEGGMREAVIERLNDGKYFIEFKVFDSTGKLDFTQKEVGIWGVSGGIYFTIYRGQVEGDSFFPSDPSDPYNYDSYKIVEVSERHLTYLGLSSGNRFTYQRIQ